MLDVLSNEEDNWEELMSRIDNPVIINAEVGVTISFNTITANNYRECTSDFVNDRNSIGIIQQSLGGTQTDVIDDVRHVGPKMSGVDESIKFKPKFKNPQMPVMK